ncbi:transporter substrate-binding domain-containing protein [Motilimonas sp. 1_MG-2023]|uniref:transporter substrate-binding domain-containing protein n=1 Tax=Motilimonas sp. 1_MG-2023 TaxID=3062672 RepID=UPI0026E1C7AC|nr:transporter substrate-binding domain-containing protein [Motilimonas sp. 1_MG-2023]MDO6524404.1 transporter substrate-binding domain-containing protein [Motilimonas sp. 1_MG-2023]
MWRVLLLCCLSFQSVAASRIQFATEASYPPFEYLDDAGQFAGLDIDLANALCRHLKAECVFHNKAFDSLIPALQFRNYDAVIAALNVTEARSALVAFTDIYYDSSAVFVAKKGTYDGAVNVKNQAIGVQNGSQQQRYLVEEPSMQGALTVPYATYAKAFADLRLGDIDAVLVDFAVADAWLQAPTNSEFEIVGKKITDVEYFGLGYGIAVNKSNKRLLRDLNKALKQIKATGEYDRIIMKYFR